MFKSSGILISNPTSKNCSMGQRWIILECCPELGRYYRANFNYENRARDVKLQKPAWDTHISVVRNEEPLHPELWGKWDGQVIEYRYNPDLQTNDEHYWLDVECDEIMSIREQLGLSRQPFIGLHITIGRVT